MGTKLPEEVEEVQQSSQTEQEISAIVEKARKRRQQQNARRRSGGLGPRGSGAGTSGAMAGMAYEGMTPAGGRGKISPAPALNGGASREEDGIEEVTSTGR